MSDPTIVIILAVFFAIRYAIQEPDPNFLSPEEYKQAAMDRKAKYLEDEADDPFADYACVKRARRGAPKK